MNGEVYAHPVSEDFVTEDLYLSNGISSIPLKEEGCGVVRSHDNLAGDVADTAIALFADITMQCNGNVQESPNMAYMPSLSEGFTAEVNDKVVKENKIFFTNQPDHSSGKENMHNKETKIRLTVENITKALRTTRPSLSKQQKLEYDILYENFKKSKTKGSEKPNQVVKAKSTLS